MKKILLLSLIFFFFGWVGFVFSTEPAETPRPLEIEYPRIIPGIEVPTTVATPISTYVRYIYYFIIGISGFVALAALIYGGFRYLISAGNPEALKDAKNQILAALLGMVILLSSWLILYNINPQLATPHLPTIRPFISELSPGIWLCKEARESEFYTIWQDIENFKNLEKQLETAAEEERESIISSLKGFSKRFEESLKKINKDCYLVKNVGPVREGFKVTRVVLVPEVKEGQIIKNYAVIGFEYSFGKLIEENDHGKLEFYYKTTLYDRPTAFIVKLDRFRSIYPMSINPNPDPAWEVIVYEEVDGNKGFAAGTKGEIKVKCQGAYYCAYRVTFRDERGNEVSPKSISFEKQKGGYIAVLSRGSTIQDYTEASAVFIADESNLLNYPRITEKDCTLGIFRCKYIPAAKVIFLISGRIY